MARSVVLEVNGLMPEVRVTFRSPEKGTNPLEMLAGHLLQVRSIMILSVAVTNVVG